MMMKKPFQRFFPITALALVITLSFISCSLDLQEDTKKSTPVVYVPVGVKPIPPVPDVSQFFGTWVTEEKDGIVKEVKILTSTYYNYVESTYLNDVPGNEQKRRYEYGGEWDYEGMMATPRRLSSFLTFSESDYITFSIQNNELTLGGGDIRYEGSSNSLKGDWSCEFETYRVDITFASYPYDKSGIMLWTLTLKPPLKGYRGECFSYDIKNDNALIFTDVYSYSNKTFKKRIELIDGKLYMRNMFVSNEQIKKYNEANKDKQFQGEMLGLFTGWTDTTDITHNLYKFLEEEYHKK